MTEKLIFLVGCQDVFPVRLSHNFLVSAVEFFFLSQKSKWTQVVLSAAQRIRVDAITCLSIHGNAKCSYVVVFGREIQSPWVAPANISFPTPLPLVTGPLHLTPLAWREEEILIGLFSRWKEQSLLWSWWPGFFWQVNRKSYVPVKWAFYHWRWSKSCSLAELPLKSKESCPSK